MGRAAEGLRRAGRTQTRNDLRCPRGTRSAGATWSSRLKGLPAGPLPGYAPVCAAASYDDYANRGESENRNKELKDGLQADRLSDHRYFANLFRLCRPPYRSNHDPLALGRFSILAASSAARSRSIAVRRGRLFSVSY